MEILPLWTKEAKLINKALDPLRLSRISDFITSNLLPGITTLTSISRNYSFYCWAIKSAIENHKNGKDNIGRYIADLEMKYVIASLLDKENNKKFEDYKGPIGKQKAKKRIDASDDGMIKTEGSVMSNPHGGYGQYYRRSLNLLGLTKIMEKKINLTAPGIKLANYFEDRIKSKELYQKHIHKNKINKLHLEDFGKVASYIRLKENANRKERDYLSKVLFSDNQNNSLLKSSRKGTFIIILKLLELTTRYDLKFNDNNYREILYFNNTEINGNIISLNKDIRNKYEVVILYWKFFQFHEYYGLVLEAILIAFIRFLKNQKEERSIKQFLIETQNFTETIINFFQEDKGFIHKVNQMILLDFLNFYIKKIGINERFSSNASQKFGLELNFNSKYFKYSEYYLANNITSLLKEKENDKYTEIIGYAILLIIVLLIRFKYYYSNYLKNDIKFFPLCKKFSKESLNLLRLLYKFEIDLKYLKLKSFYEHLLERIISQHNKVAFDKLKQGNNTYRFKKSNTESSKYYYLRDYEYEKRNSRFRVITSLFEDFGFIKMNKKDDDKYYLITELGKKKLKELI